MKIGMNLLLWTTQVNDNTFPIMEALRQTGYDGVEIPIGEGDSKSYSAVRGQLDNLGLSCTAITSLAPENNPISPDPAVRRAALNRLKWAIEMAATMGSELLCGPFHSAYKAFSGMAPTGDENRWGVDVLRQAAEFAAGHNVCLALEPLNRFECYFLNTMADAHAFVRQVAHPNCRLIYDTHHSNIEEKSPAIAIEGCADDIAHVHISENHRGTPGTGQVNWFDNFTALKRINYQNWLVIEAFSTAVPDFASAIHVWRDFAASPEDVYTEGFRFIQKMWQEVK
jgi:D-psicose/D-tagatose/L-ribulose 3-epimerase